MCWSFDGYLIVLIVQYCLRKLPSVGVVSEQLYLNGAGSIPKVSPSFHPGPSIVQKESEVWLGTCELARLLVFSRPTIRIQSPSGTILIGDVYRY
jgi:hypothetical protein